MSAARTESVGDPAGILTEQDHMRDMDRIRMEVLAIATPSPSVARVTARIAPADPSAWMPANLAIRIEVETPPGERPVSRIYTVRRFDPAASTIEVDFVIHEDDSPAMRWLRAARAGDHVWLTGPRQHFVPDHELAKRAAIFADETAIPAVYAILNDWPEGAQGDVWIETDDRAAFDELPRPQGVALNLLLRRPDQPAGSTGALFAAAQAALTDPARHSLWAAGERQEMRHFRDHFRALGMARQDIRVFGYWRRGTSSSEIDRIRLREYSALRQTGARLEDFSDADLPI
ncbi:siderophore-interacting protein [Paracoccus sp. DMF-8]|uniref:siderophore-interacting protein n=1 Tax=Paracoccus sp. DMF-8 TaxID=3019445 RepID=UPI0023E3DDDA|nr:siderophore-interacting protein [Paracoccus sp. DMF-8]MDF3608159.1 siderophore-interacting protein [Paracoccus sp. DMF-8]